MRLTPIWIKRIAEQLGKDSRFIRATTNLLEEGCTIAFIARYRKDRTGGMNEVEIETVRDLMQSAKVLEDRRSFILETIFVPGYRNEELKKKIMECFDRHELEDLYQPFRKRRKTRADTARDLGLEPLAGIIFNQKENNINSLLSRFNKQGTLSADAVLQGARDIIAEWISEQVNVKNALRNLFTEKAFIESTVVKAKKEKAENYRDYFQFHESVKSIPAHRIMAIFRGVEEGYLRFCITPEQEQAIGMIEKLVLKFRNASGEQVRIAIQDSWKRLLQPALENECKNNLLEKAENEAIRIFAENLKQLLLSAPLGPKRILAIDPGIRTGCKAVCLDHNGNLLQSATLFIHTGPAEREKATVELKNLCNTYKPEAIAIGDGTAGRETEQFVKSKIPDIPTYLVNEDGASVYSVSEAAREEFPGLDVTVKGTVSIGRRLMDPLSELVKIDPKSIGVGQYQHDVNPGKLKLKLDQTVENCVNHVGVNLNTASWHLLSYVSGLGPALARQIVDFRSKYGSFSNRSQLKEIPRLGPKAFEQCAGFLRIIQGDNPLDKSGVHPEHYPVVQQMAKDLRTDIAALIGNHALIAQIDIAKYETESVGKFTLSDILKDLQKPMNDPRDSFSVTHFAPNIRSVQDLKPGMQLPGKVTNITAFGAFIDIGLKQDGLVHISQLADKFVKDPNEVVRLHQNVLVKVLEIDASRNRISLSMKSNA